jgi:hypothetical protein
MEPDPIEACPFCAQQSCKLVETPDGNAVGGIVLEHLFHVKCDWCGAQGPTSRDAHRAVGTWNHVSRAAKKDKELA